jgi:hypothetical protein
VEGQPCSNSLCWLRRLFKLSVPGQWRKKAVHLEEVERRLGLADFHAEKKMSESKQNDTSAAEVSAGTSPLCATPRALAVPLSLEEEISREHREWLERAAASFQRMAVDPKYREERSKMGF